MQRRARRITPATLEKYVCADFEYDAPRLNGLRARESGVIFACPHYGPFIACGLLFAWLGDRGRPTNVFYDPPAAVAGNLQFDQLFARFEDRLRILHSDQRGLVDSMRALRHGHSLGIMFDVNQRPDRSLMVPFFGRLYPAMGGTAYLSLQSGAPIVPTYAAPTNSGRVLITLSAAIEPHAFRGLEKDEAIFRLTSALFADFEKQLRIAPWHWIYWSTLRGRPMLALDDPAQVDWRRELISRLQSVSTLMPECSEWRELF